MFNDPQTIAGGIIGVLVIVIGTALAVLGHIRRERREDSESDPS